MPGAERALPVAEALLTKSCLEAFRDEFEEHLGRECPRPRDLTVPKIVDFDEQNCRFTFDESYRRKRPDWTYAER